MFHTGQAARSQTGLQYYNISPARNMAGTGLKKLQNILPHVVCQTMPSHINTIGLCELIFNRCLLASQNISQSSKASSLFVRSLNREQATPYISQLLVNKPSQISLFLHNVIMTSPKQLSTRFSDLKRHTQRTY